ncbi:MAG: VWA domain-containing protein, partial [Chlorobiaceae bacterium]|nr:VWA domain-containing protein [Chlorobiaceae bacterium]
MCFARPALLWLLCLAIPLVALAFHGARRKLSVWRKLDGSGGVSGVLPALSFPKIAARRVMFVASVALMLLAAAGPELCSGLKPERRKGLDVIFMLDVSNSMRATDVAPDRLSAAKSELLRISRTLGEGRKALLLFAGSPVVQCPLTGDAE